MKPLARTLVELEAEEGLFLSRPHSAKMYYQQAKNLWENEKNQSLASGKDRWQTLSKYSVNKKSGQPRAFGAEIITALRKHLGKLQSSRCCYCRRWLQNIAHARPIEHILSRDDYPQFSVHYLNLALCCRDCNQLKSNKNWSLLPKTATEYPKEAIEYFHPRLHLFDGHIRYIRIETNDAAVAIYQGLTDPGRQLCRDHLKTISQVDALFKNNSNISNAIKRLQAAGESVDPRATAKLLEFTDMLHQAVHRIADET